MSHPTRDIARYYRGELTSSAERDALFTHLRGCEACRASFDAESEAQRALSGGKYSRVELESMLPAVLDGALPRERKPFLAWAPWAGALLAAAASVLLFFRPGDELTAKGGGPREAPPVNVICFDAEREVTARLAQSGACHAPGFLKVIYAGAETVPVLTVLVLAAGEVRAHAVVRGPDSGAVLPDFARLAPGEVLDVIAIAGEAEVPLDVAKDARAVLTVRGQP